MMIDTQAFVQETLETYKNWLTPISDDNPCGDDLSAEQEYLELKSECDPAISSFAAVEEKNIQWPSIFDQTHSLIEKTKDINIFMWHCRAALNSYGLVGFAKALTASLAAIDQFWEGVYPLLDEDDENDPYERVLALQSVDELSGMLHDLINCPLIKDKQGSKIVLSDLLSENHHIVQSAVDSTVVPLTDGLDEAQNSKIIKKVLQNVALNDLELDFESDEGDKPNSESSGLQKGIVQNRNDVEKMLEMIISYYQREEPSSPIPFLLQRAKSFVNKDFIEIISELSPGGASEAKSICGIEE